MSAFVDEQFASFLLFDWLKLDEVSKHTAKHVLREDILATISLASQLSAEQLAPHLRKSDMVEPFMDDSGAVRILPEVRNGLIHLVEAGLFGMSLPLEQGGSGFPFASYALTLSILMAGSIGASSYLMLTVANARLITRFGSAALICAYGRPQIEGRYFGTMCLSEPHAGSSLRDIATSARPDGEDTLGPRYRVRGTKMWISGADHDVSENIVHLVLAKVEEHRRPSLFLLPKFLPDGSRNEVEVIGLNHKMGYRAIPNCVLQFGAEEGARGWLIGEEGEGLNYLFQMMNEMRVAVGIGGAALSYRGYLASLNYARDRIQGRRPGSDNPVAIIEHPDVRSMLLSQKSFSEGGLALTLYAASLIDSLNTAGTERDRIEAMLALLTPIVKSWPSIWSQKSLNLAIQIHGGAGYTRDHIVELLYRDNKLNSIHEGTTGIQAIDLLGRKILLDGPNALAVLGEKILATIARARAGGALGDLGDELEAYWFMLMETVNDLADINDRNSAVANATDFLLAIGHVVVGWLWLDMALACERNADDATRKNNFSAGKIVTCQHFFEVELPKVAHWLQLVGRSQRAHSHISNEQF